METLQSSVKYWYLPNKFHTSESSLNLTFLHFFFIFLSRLKWRIDILDEKKNEIRSENQYGNFFTSVINVIKIYYYYSFFLLVFFVLSLCCNEYAMIASGKNMYWWYILAYEWISPKRGGKKNSKHSEIQDNTKCFFIWFYDDERTATMETE